MSDEVEQANLGDVRILGVGELRRERDQRRRELDLALGGKMRQHQAGEGLGHRADPHERVAVGRRAAGAGTLAEAFHGDLAVTNDSDDESRQREAAGFGDATCVLIGMVVVVNDFRVQPPVAARGRAPPSVAEAEFAFPPLCPSPAKRCRTLPPRLASPWTGAKNLRREIAGTVPSTRR